MIIRNSFKQLFRKPGKAIIFFVLMAGATMLLVFGAAMFAQNTARIKAAEGLFTTVATIEQPVRSAEYETVEDHCMGEITRRTVDYGETVTPEDLIFPGAEYVHEPENRASYLTYLPDVNPARTRYSDLHVVEFQLAEDYKPGEPVEVQVTRRIYPALDIKGGLEGGYIIQFCQHGCPEVPLERGKTYITSLVGDLCPEHGTWEQTPGNTPHSTQHDKQGNLVESSVFSGNAQAGLGYVEEVTGDFYEPGGRGEIWQAIGDEAEISKFAYPVLAINSFDMLPCYREDKLHLRRGRMITQEELDSGAKVCMISNELAFRNLIYEGDKITLPMLCAMYGYDSESSTRYDYNFMDDFRLFNADGEIYDTFWEAEYEVVGMFSQRYGAEEIKFTDMFIVPQKSIGASDENNIAYYKPMVSFTGAFQIPNGSIEEFDAALREACPKAGQVTIEYDDMGYARTIESLNDARRTAFLLFAVGLLSCIAIVALLLYFFIIREKRRTAIERSMGLSRLQCRVSLMAALLTLTVLSTGIGSGLGALLMGNVDTFAELTVQEEVVEDEGVKGELGMIGYSEDTTYKSERWNMGGIYNFSAKYSLWAMWDAKGSLAALEAIDPPPGLYMLAPVALWALIAIAAGVLVGRNMKIEPILLLSVKG